MHLPLSFSFSLSHSLSLSVSLPVGVPNSTLQVITKKEGVVQYHSDHVAMTLTERSKVSGQICVLDQ